MGWADASRGIQGAVQQQLLRRMQEQQLVAQAAEAERRSARETRADDRLDRDFALRAEQYDAGQARLGAQDKIAADALAFTQGNTLAEQVPGGTFMPEGDPTAAKLPSYLLQSTPERPAMGQDFAGPMPGGESPQQAQVGRPGGFIKTRTNAQRNMEEDDARALQTAADAKTDRLADNARADEAARATAAYRLASLNKPTGGTAAAEKKSWIMRNGQPVRASEGEIQPGDTPYNAAAPEKAAAKVEAQEGAEQTRRVAVSTIDRMLTHPGLSKSSGIVSSKLSRFSPDATDFNALRDQVVATLALPNLSLLKGPMSDKDILFVKQLATRLSNENMSDEETVRSLHEAKAFLDKPAAGGAVGTSGGTQRMRAPDGRLLNVPADKVAEMEKLGATRD